MKSSVGVVDEAGLGDKRQANAGGAVMSGRWRPKQGYVLKDWMPGFDDEIGELYRDGGANAELAREAELSGELWFTPPARSVGQILADMPVLLCHAGGTESPIEGELAMAFIAASRSGASRDRVHYVPLPQLDHMEVRKRAETEHAYRHHCIAYIFPQALIAKYRVDFLVWVRGAEEWSGFIVECDGRDYHGTPAQIARDQQRDRALKAIGYPVLRFSGSEIRGTADKCVATVLRVIAARSYPPPPEQALR